MKNAQSISVFDIIGPIMVGPSSSHTAGAVRLGRLGLAMFGQKPQKALIELHGSFAETGRGHGTDKALVAGLLGLETDDPGIRESFDLAKQQGLDFEFAEVDLGEDAHPNSVRVTLTAGNETFVFIGCSTGGGMIEITNIEGYPVNLSGEYDTLLVISEDQPGTINAITGWLLNKKINVAFLKVGRNQRGGEAIMIIETDQRIPDYLVEFVSVFPWVKTVRNIPRLQE
jgi:L-serine dehydratase